MYNITLICTIHEECGKCNSNELHKIIESISPDVIFEELSHGLFDAFYKKNQFSNKESLEVKSIKKYLQNHNIEHIPVDIDVNQNLTKSEIDYMFYTFKQYDVYKKIDNEQCLMIERGGFDFLNSKKCTELFDKKKITEKKLMEFMINKNLLFRIHELFYEEHDNRENKIIENIYDYSKENQYNQALLLIGSGHRKSIIEKIEKYKIQENIKLNWTFFNEI